MEIEVPVKVALFTLEASRAGSALSLIIVLVSSFAYRQYLYAQPVVAYVSLDSVGSVELEVNGAGIVKSATALDAAAKKRCPPCCTRTTRPEKWFRRSSRRRTRKTRPVLSWRWSQPLTPRHNLRKPRRLRRPWIALRRRSPVARGARPPK
jgi:hypothetical protein